MDAQKRQKKVRFLGADNFRWRLVLSCIANVPVFISKINDNGTSTAGMGSYGASFVDLLEKLTGGAQVEFNHNGTAVKFSCGSVVGGHVHHVMPKEKAGFRSLAYVLEPIALLALFGREPLELTLDGVTEGTRLDISADNFKFVNLPILRKFTENASLEIVSRSFCPTSPGRVILKVDPVRKIKPFLLKGEQALIRVRGNAVSRASANVKSRRMLDGCKTTLSAACSDTWIYSDQSEKKMAISNSVVPGVAICVVAESADSENSVPLGVDASYHQEVAAEVPKEVSDVSEELGVSVAKWLLHEVSEGSAVDTHRQALIMCLMACAVDDGPSQIRIKRLAPYAPQILRDIRDILGVEMQIEEHDVKNKEKAHLNILCRGCGVVNAYKPSF